MKTLIANEVQAVSGGAFQHSDGNWYEMIEVAPGRYQMVPVTPPLSNGPVTYANAGPTVCPLHEDLPMAP